MKKKDYDNHKNIINESKLRESEIVLKKKVFIILSIINMSFITADAFAKKLHLCNKTTKKEKNQFYG